MRSDLTDITIVLDGSGSMLKRRDDTIAGFDVFVDAHRRADGDATLSLLVFNESLQWVFTGRPLAAVQPLDDSDYRPNSGTALLDALGTAITVTGDRLSRMPERDRPGKVILLTISDGLENSSSRFTKPQVNDLIRHQTDAYQWLFTFLGTTFDAIGEAGSLGIPQAVALNFTDQKGGVRRAYAAAGAATTRARGQHVNSASMWEAATYTTAERQDAATPDED